MPTQFGGRDYSERLIAWRYVSTTNFKKPCSKCTAAGTPHLSGQRWREHDPASVLSATRLSVCNSMYVIFAFVIGVSVISISSVISRPASLKKKPGSAFGFVDVNLQQAGCRNVIVVVTNCVRLPHRVSHFLVVFQKLVEHV